MSFPVRLPLCPGEGVGWQLGAEDLDTFRHTKLAMINHGAKAHDLWWFPYADADTEAFPGKSIV